MAVGNGTITRASKDSTRSALDFYPTPAIAVHTLLDEELFVGDVWECASGRGDISLALLERGLSVVSSDVQGEDWIFGEKNVDFLQTHRVVTNIITNPPYQLLNQFILHALKCATGKVALMVRLATLEGVGRMNTIYKPHPPSKVLVMSKRLPMWYFREQKWGAGNTYAHMWLVWDQEDKSGQTKLVWR